MRQQPTTTTADPIPAQDGLPEAPPPAASDSPAAEVPASTETPQVSPAAASDEIEPVYAQASMDVKTEASFTITAPDPWTDFVGAANALAENYRDADDVDVSLRLILKRM